MSKEEENKPNNESDWQSTVNAGLWRRVLKGGIMHAGMVLKITKSCEDCSWWRAVDGTRPSGEREMMVGMAGIAWYDRDLTSIR